jgi:hypothetical protein
LRGKRVLASAWQPFGNLSGSTERLGKRADRLLWIGRRKTRTPNALRDELIKEPLRLEADGTVKPPERPGLGIELDRVAVDRYRVAEPPTPIP